MFIIEPKAHESPHRLASWVSADLAGEYCEAFLPWLMVDNVFGSNPLTALVQASIVNLFLEISLVQPGVLACQY